MYRQTVKTQFNKGLLTEFSELGFPQEASVDELNCQLLKNGTRRKRLGLAEEVGTPTVPHGDGQLVHSGFWENVGGDAATDYLVVQVAANLYLYELGTEPLIDNPVLDSGSNPVVIDMTTYNTASGLGAANSRVSFASINGLLAVVSPQIDPFFLSIDDDGYVQENTISFKVRDFEWLGDRIEYSEEVATADVTDERQYDTLNAGWTEDVLATWTGSEGTYPPLTLPWYSGKTSAGAFSVSEWREIYAGNTSITNGHFILDLFNKDRSAEANLYDSGDPIIPVVEDTRRFNCVASYAGRIFYGGLGTKVYFSQYLEDEHSLGYCFQQNDPTSEEFSDLLDTDGGYVSIPEAVGIRELHVFGASLLIFASNGVWKVSGIDDVFRATEYSVTKISSFGLAVRGSFVSGQNNAPFWWSNVGIHTVIVDENGIFREVNLTRDTIQTFWSALDQSAKTRVTGVFDEAGNRVIWLYPDNGETVEVKFNNLLLFDVDLSAFYPWRISDTDVSSPYVLDAYFYRGTGSSQTTYNVVDSSGNQVVDSLGNEVITTRKSGVLQNTELKMLVRTGDGLVGLASFTDVGFTDWGEADYSSYLESAYEFKGDLGRQKSAPYYTVFLRRTEEGLEESDGVYTTVRGSSLKVSSFWDFKDQSSSIAQEVYRLKTPVVVDPDNPTVFDYPTSVITTRLKLRGRGRSVRLRFEGQEGKDFHLLGWETLDFVKGSY